MQRMRWVWRDNCSDGVRGKPATVLGVQHPWLGYPYVRDVRHAVPVVKDALGTGGDQFYHTEHILTAGGLVPESFGWCGSPLHPYPSGRSHLGRVLQMHTGLRVSVSAVI